MEKRMVSMSTLRKYTKEKGGWGSKVDKCKARERKQN